MQCMLCATPHHFTPTPHPTTKKQAVLFNVCLTLAATIVWTLYWLKHRTLSEEGAPPRAAYAALGTTTDDEFGRESGDEEGGGGG